MENPIDKVVIEMIFFLYFPCDSYQAEYFLGVLSHGMDGNTELFAHLVLRIPFSVCLQNFFFRH